MLHWQPISWAKSVNSAHCPLFVAMTFQNELEYRKADQPTSSSNDSPTSCEKNILELRSSNSRVYEGRTQFCFTAIGCGQHCCAGWATSQVLPCISINLVDTKIAPLDNQQIGQDPIRNPGDADVDSPYALCVCVGLFAPLWHVQITTSVQWMILCNAKNELRYYARQHNSAYMLWQFRPSVRLSVRHTGGSVKNGSSQDHAIFTVQQPHPSSFSRVSFIPKF